jgi:hypothetical protein
VFFCSFWILNFGHFHVNGCAGGAEACEKVKSCDVEGKGVIDIGGKGALGRYKTWSLTSIKGHRVVLSFLNFEFWTFPRKWPCGLR